MVRKNSRKGKANGVAMAAALHDPNNGKQNNENARENWKGSQKSKERNQSRSRSRSKSTERRSQSTERKSRNRKSVERDREIQDLRNVDGGTQYTTRVAFEEDNEIMDLEVTAEQERELLGGEPETSDMPAQFGDREENMENMEEQLVDNVSEGDDGCVIFQPQRRRPSGELDNSNDNASGSKKIRNAEESELGLKEDEAELQSMLKFTKFLEERGYIRQRSPERTQTKERNEREGKSARENLNKKARSQSKDEGINNILTTADIHNEDGDSVVTIYRWAIPMIMQQSYVEEENNKVTNNRISTSSEEDQSGDEITRIIPRDEEELNETSNETNKQLLYEKFVDCRLREHRKESRETRPGERRYVVDDEMPSTSRRKSYDTAPRMTLPPAPPRQTLAEIAEERTKELLRKAENSKANMLQVPGRESLDSNYDNVIFSSSDLFHSVVVDEDYSAIGKHIDEGLRKRIQEGEFVDFARLIPRDQVLALNDNRIELVNNNGRPELRSVSEVETIGSFGKWEQAFRIFSTVYTDRYPERAKQLLQYNHIIFSASLTFTWSNVYAYDIDF